MTIQKSSRYCRISPAVLVVFASASCAICTIKEAVAKEKLAKFDSKNNTETDEEDENSSIWDSKPEEIRAVNIQVLDKTSGKVIKKKINVNEPLRVGSIEITLKRCFKNAPEDSKEIYAFVEIRDGKFLPFARWLFASSPSVNLFAHPQYDVRVEF